ncbi:hypothetical protein QFC21_002180 [Naganishia friedmannii]|uniref:Uncharacterized protein n=1 Tax=Naganishia friedmannii TaxID=89922 RepID=A0ACC2W0R7_9TREE|nr:hypothetical protein QFC21_002180 [Naganishia friedmannii]
MSAFQNTFSSEPSPPSIMHRVEDTIGSATSTIRTLVGSVRAPLPTATGDGSKLDAGQKQSSMQELEGLVADFSKFSAGDWKTLLETVKLKVAGDPIDDKTYYTERLIQETAKLAPGSMVGDKLSDGLLSQLWNDLQHPPQSYLGEKYKYRSADGSNNSFTHPDLGKAGTAYARSVAPNTVQSPALPDPGVIFDSIMARKDENREPHPNKISSVLFYLAAIIIHDLFRTDHEDYNISLTSSYLDLAPLYGSNHDEQEWMRTGEDGKIKPDCYSEKRLMGFPPGCSVLLIMFNRFHNYVVEQLALINEGGRFNKPDPSLGPHAKTLEERDEDLFQTGRLITCSLYVNIILLDYVRTILNLNKTNDNWHLDPRKDIPGLPLATGNQVSAEFNLVYRWHAAISERDEKWTESFYAKLFPDVQDPSKLSLREFVERLGELEKNTPVNPFERGYFGEQERDHESGLYNDDYLVDVIASSIEDPANSFGAQRVPIIMRAVEVLGIQQARTWNVSTLNEFRKFFDLKPHATFEDINPDPHVADQLRRLYDQPDLVELYPGLVAEEAKQPMVPGAGLCPGFTISRAVLSDATALVRGDRFCTVDHTPARLTNYGYNLVSYDYSVDNGCVLHKLILRAFPNHFKPDSVYAHYPFTIPKEMKSVLTTLGRKANYTYDRPQRLAQPQVIYTYAAVKAVLDNQQAFHVPWGPAMEKLMGPLVNKFALAGDGKANAESRHNLIKALYPPEWEGEVKAYYLDKCTELLRSKKYKIGNGINQVDIVRDVGNIAPVHLAADMFSLPLKTVDNPMGAFTESELSLILIGIFTDVFLDLDPVASMGLRAKAYQACQALSGFVKLSVDSNNDVLDRLIMSFKKGLGDGARAHTQHPLSKYGAQVIERLQDSGGETAKFVWGYIMSTVTGQAPPQGQIFAQVIEYYLTEGQEHLPAMRQLALKDDDASFDKLMHYFQEGARLAGETAVFRDVKQKASVQDGSRTLDLNAGDKLMVNFRAASRDPTVFPDPDVVKLDRDIKLYIHQGYGPHQCAGLAMSRITLTALLKVVLRDCPGIRPAPGPQGKIKKVETVLGPEELERREVRFHKYLTANGDSYWPMPTTLKVNWDNA